MRSAAAPLPRAAGCNGRRGRAGAGRATRSRAPLAGGFVYVPRPLVGWALGTGARAALLALRHGGVTTAARPPAAGTGSCRDQNNCGVARRRSQAGWDARNPGGPPGRTCAAEPPPPRPPWWAAAGGGQRPALALGGRRAAARCQPARNAEAAPGAAARWRRPALLRGAAAAAAAPWDPAGRTGPDRTGPPWARQLPQARSAGRVGYPAF